MIRDGVRITLLFLLGLAVPGCNTSRYGVNYDSRLSQYKRIVVIPLGVQIFSLHTGGNLEPRTDITSEVQPRLLKEVADLVTERGLTPVVVQEASAAGPDAERVPQGRLLAMAIREAIHTHHYEYGSATTFDYSVGGVAHELVPSDGSADAVLGVGLTGIVPTGGRVGLKVTALIVGGLLGVHNFVKINETALTMMLVDARTGEVVWYNQDTQQLDARSKHPLRNLVKEVGAYLLRPRKG